MTFGKKWPCYRCEQHTESCHMVCERYLEEREKLRADIEPGKTENAMIGGYISDAVRKVRKSRAGLIKNYRPKGRR